MDPQLRAKSSPILTSPSLPPCLSFWRERPLLPPSAAPTPSQLPRLSLQEESCSHTSTSQSPRGTGQQRLPWVGNRACPRPVSLPCRLPPAAPPIPRAGLSRWCATIPPCSSWPWPGRPSQARGSVLSHPLLAWETRSRCHGCVRTHGLRVLDTIPVLLILRQIHTMERTCAHVLRPCLRAPSPRGLSSTRGSRPHGGRDGTAKFSLSATAAWWREAPAGLPPLLAGATEATVLVGRRIHAFMFFCRK